MGGRAALAILAALPSCASGAPTMPLPTWSGHVVSAKPSAGGLRVEMTVPTAGHQLALEEVVVDGALAEVHLRYAPPTGELVAQVVTTLGVDVAGAELGQARAVAVLVKAGQAAPQLAVALALPAP